MLRFFASLQGDGSQLKGEAKAVAREMEGVAGAAHKVTAEGTKTAQSIDRLEAEARTATTALRAMDAAADAAAQTNRIAAGSVANLTAQFNDIGVMLAAGQNPLQLAIQQGTQISQVLGPQGARGAARALGAAFMGLISPVNLITIGSIAAGAAMFQWLTSSTEQGEDLAKVLEDINASTQEAQRNTAQMALGLDNAEQLSLLDAIIAKRQEIDRLVAAEAEATGGHVRRNAALRLRAAQEELVSLQDQLDANRAALAIEREAANAAKEREAAQERAARSREQDTAWGQQQLAVLNAQTQEMLLLSRYGEDSAEVAQFRARAEREAYEQLLDSKNITSEFRAELMGTFLEAQALAGLDVGAGIREAAAAASELARNLNISFEAAMGIGGADRARLGVQDEFLPSGLRRDDIISRTTRPARVATASRGRTGAGRGTAARVERDAVAELIARQQDELALLRETDPVQKELLRNREALAKATDAERAQVETLISTRLAEEAAMDRLEAQRQAFADTAYDALEGLILRGESARDVIDNLTDALAQAALKALLLGQGPLAGLFGTSGDGGLFGVIGGALFPKRAEGGMIYGAGGPRQDKQLIAASPGEFVVNARATARNRALLEALNAGALQQGFATGGAVGFGPGAGGPLGGTGTQLVKVEVTASKDFDVRVQQTAVDVTSQALDQYDRDILPSSVERVSTDPRRRG